MLQLLKEEAGGENTSILPPGWIMRDMMRGGSGDDLDHQDLQQCPPGWIVGKDKKKYQGKLGWPKEIIFWLPLAIFIPALSLQYFGLFV